MRGLLSKGRIPVRYALRRKPCVTVKTRRQLSTNNSTRRCERSRRAPARDCTRRSEVAPPHVAFDQLEQTGELRVVRRPRTLCDLEEAPDEPRHDLGSYRLPAVHADAHARVGVEDEQQEASNAPGLTERRLHKRDGEHSSAEAVVEL
jgi:hypothetical protein